MDLEMNRNSRHLGNLESSDSVISLQAMSTQRTSPTPSNKLKVLKSILTLAQDFPFTQT